MKKLRKLLLLPLGVVILVACVIELSAKPASVDKPEVAVRTIESQVVLYTIHRGSYEQIGMVIGQLFAKAAEHGIAPLGPVTFAYLNNPTKVSSEHWLTEIRIPVAQDAMKLAGTLGKMTDVKTVSAQEVVVSIKPETMSDPGPVYNKLFAWINQEGYLPTDGPLEIFLSNAATGDYSQMKTEIMIPIGKPD